MRPFILLAMLVVSVYSQGAGDQTSLNPSGCGRRSQAFGKRSADSSDPGKIVGGTVVADPKDYNWQVLMRKSGSFICGGSLINSIWVLTAAHCVYNSAAASFSVLLGAFNQNPTSSSVEATWVLTRTISKLVVNANYNPSTFANDVALMKMSSAITYRHEIGPVCLATTSNYAGLMGIATGWGTTTSGGSLSSQLRFVELLIRTDADCVSTNPNAQPTSMICAGIVGDGKDTCQGDSGGPLVYCSNNICYQVGITSWGRGCGNVGVYSHVAKLYTWIETQVKAG